MCLIPEGRGIFPNLTVDREPADGDVHGTHYDDVLDRVFAQFPRLGERRKQTAGTLSGGEQQMLAMARALATDPAVLLIDELSMGLAPIIVEELYEHVRRIAASGLSILIVEQFAHEILGVADRAGIMLHGRILQTGARRLIADELADAYLGGPSSTGTRHDSGARRDDQREHGARRPDAPESAARCRRRARPVPGRGRQAEGHGRRRPTPSGSGASGASV